MSKILVVGGQVWVSEMISQFLASNGYETMTAESGGNALARIDLFRPDLVLLDIELPDMSGYDVCKKIKQNRETQYIMVLCMTSLETREMSVRLISVGADDFTEKNIDLALLLMKIKSLLRVKELSDQLTQKFAELEEKNSILEFQMQMGKQVQRSLMPSTDVVFNDMRVSARYMPAMDIGGDFYNLVRVDDDRCVILIGDVSGHGISAALLTAMFNSMVINHAGSNSQPNRLLEKINSEYCKIFDSASSTTYACIFCAVVDTRERTILYSNAGGCLPLFVDAASGTVSELDAAGLPVGMGESPSYECKTAGYNSGDMLLFHTDGLMDTFYKDKPEEFSERINTVLLSAGNLPTEEAADAVISEFYNFNPTRNEKFSLDDVSIIVCGL